MGKYTPPRSAENVEISQVTGSPFLKSIINPAEIIPILEKQIMDKIKIIPAKKKLGLNSFIPKKNIPNSKYIITFSEEKRKSHKEEAIIMIAIGVGVMSIASKVPANCSLRMLKEKDLRAVEKYPEKAMPNKTNGKYSPPYSLKYGEAPLPKILAIK